MTLGIEVSFEAKAALEGDERARCEQLAQSCRAVDGLDPGLHYDTHLNVLRDMPSWFLAWGRGRDTGPCLLGAACLFAPSRSEAELSAAVGPLYRRQGIFSGLYALAGAALRAAGVPSMLLAADARMDFGRALAGKLGGERSHGEHRLVLRRCDAAVGRHGDEIRLIPVSGADLDGAVSLSVEVFGGEPRDARLFMEGALADPRREQFLAMGEHGAVGMVSWSRDEGGWILYGLGVTPAARGIGLGGAILDTALAVLFARGAEQVALEVDDANAAALALYASRGFKDDAKTDYWRVPVA